MESAGWCPVCSCMRHGQARLGLVWVMVMRERAVRWLVARAECGVREGRSQRVWESAGDVRARALAAHVPSLGLCPACDVGAQPTQDVASPPHAMRMVCRGDD